MVEKSPVCGCADCGLLFLNPLPARSYPDVAEMVPLESDVLTSLYKANAAERLRQLINYSGLASGNLLLVGTDRHLTARAEELGFHATALTADEFESSGSLPLEFAFDACILFCSLERLREPLEALARIKRALNFGGCLMVVSPTVDTTTAKRFRHSWWEFHRSNFYYFSVDTLQSLLLKAGFGEPYIVPDRSLVSLKYLKKRLAAKAIRSKRRLRWAHSALSIAPLPQNRKFRASTGRMCFFARSVERSLTPRLSVIVPVFNEKATCSEVLDQLLEKTIEGVDIEVIIVESNSTDGSRELVSAYRSHPRVKLLLEGKPSGKGHAVRTGLQSASGDVILFQDADLEYDLNDYDGLVRPLFKYQRNFVLGSRHNQTNTSWKIRNFSDSPGLAGIFNFGHLVFLTLFNAIYSQKLSDPFTMFKVFRRECLYGLTFECNRFDFDYEIVIKLLRKGYQPKEIPVNYTSRSIAEGKKVTLFRDPITWIRALLKFKRSPLYARNL